MGLTNLSSSKIKILSQEHLDAIISVLPQYSCFDNFINCQMNPNVENLYIYFSYNIAFDITTELSKDDSRFEDHPFTEIYFDIDKCEFTNTEPTIDIEMPNNALKTAVARFSNQDLSNTTINYLNALKDVLNDCIDGIDNFLNNVVKDYNDKR